MKVGMLNSDFALLEPGLLQFRGIVEKSPIFAFDFLLPVVCENLLSSSPELQIRVGEFITSLSDSSYLPSHIAKAIVLKSKAVIEQAYNDQGVVPVKIFNVYGQLAGQLIARNLHWELDDLQDLANVFDDSSVGASNDKKCASLAFGFGVWKFDISSDTLAHRFFVARLRNVGENLPGLYLRRLMNSIASSPSTPYLPEPEWDLVQKRLQFRNSEADAEMLVAVRVDSRSWVFSKISRSDESNNITKSSGNIIRTAVSKLSASGLSGVHSILSLFSSKDISRTSTSAQNEDHVKVPWAADDVLKPTWRLKDMLRDVFCCSTTSTSSVFQTAAHA